MTAWNADEPARIGKADELQITSRRSDGSFRPYVTIWVVRSGDEQSHTTEVEVDKDGGASGCGGDELHP